MIRVLFLLIVLNALGVKNFFVTEKFFPSDTVEIFNESETEQSIARIENRPNNNEPIRNFLKSYNSLRPIAVLVDNTPESLTSASNFLKEVFTLAPSAKQITFFTSKFNSTGMDNLTETPGSDFDTIKKYLNFEFKQEYSELGVKQSLGTLVFYAVLNAAINLPQDGAILIFIDRKINDEDLATHTNIIRKKNIKVYVVWGGPYPTKTKEERLLKELCSYSGGLFLNNGIKDLSSYNYRTFLNNVPNMNTTAILSKINLKSDFTFTFPIDTEVSCMYLIINPEDTQGTLITPTGEHVDVKDNDSIASHGTGSFGISERGQREIYLDATQPAGLWRLDVKASASSIPCNVTIFVCSKLTAQAYLVRDNSATEISKQKRLKLDFTGRISKVNNISIISDKGQLLANDIKYNDTDNNEVDVELSHVPDKSFQVLIEGTDVQGNHFSRISYVNDRSYSNAFPQPILTIDVGIGSELIITGGRSSTITFEVTNLRNTAADTRFFCKDEKSILRSLQPLRRIISPQETATITLILSVRNGIYQDLITFAAAVGSDYVEKKVIVDVGTQSQYTGDNTPPYLDYSYLSDCSKVIFSNCDQGTWTIEAKAKDLGSGLLQLNSIPKGLYFQDGFTTGTKEEVTGTYSDSCCNADIQLIAIDRVNNRRTISANAYRAIWGPGQIAALILGIILLILIIVLIVYLIRRCLKKRENYNLPTYRGRI